MLTVWIAALQGLLRTTFHPRENVWVTLGRAANTTTFCAILSTPSAPFVMCLIGVPLNDSDWDVLNQMLRDSKKQWGDLRGQDERYLGCAKNMSEWFEKYDNWDDCWPRTPGD